jgi:hypothetical protein
MKIPENSDNQIFMPDMNGSVTTGRWISSAYILVLALACSLTGCGDGGPSGSTNIPPQPTGAAEVGYSIHTFSTRSFNSSTVDTAATERQGFQWYNWDFYGYRADPSAAVLNLDGSVTLNGATGGAGGQLVTAVQDSASDPFVGTSFGGGAYIEAVLKWQPLTSSSATTSSFPAFWALPIEGNFSPYSDQWPGQPAGYTHSIETDFFEAEPNDAGTDMYGGSLHDWYGIVGETCPPGFCQANAPYQDGQRAVPAGTDFTQYHRYGFLWVPATATSSGYAKFYFDGMQIGYTYQWDPLPSNAIPPPVNQPWEFSILDQEHLYIILGTGPLQPMTVKSVDVWQPGASDNIGN